jgi:hypothetical protein
VQGGSIPRRLYIPGEVAINISHVAAQGSWIGTPAHIAQNQGTRSVKLNSEVRMWQTEQNWPVHSPQNVAKGAKLHGYSVCLYTQYIGDKKQATKGVQDQEWTCQFIQHFGI